MVKDTLTITSRAEARAAGLKWCWVHEAFAPIEKFGKSAGRPDGLQPMCRLAKSGQEKKRRAKREGYVPRVCEAVRTAAPEATKWCVIHAGYCERAEFGNDARHGDGLQSSCRRAMAERDAAATGRTGKASKYNPPPDGMKWCWWHKRHEPKNVFQSVALRAKDRSGLAGMCQAAVQEYYKANVERYLAHVHTRRARKQANGGVHTKADVQRIGEAQGWKCHWCSKPTKAKYHIDHLVPLSKGGTNWPRNLVIACVRCNSSKGATDPIIFAQRIGLLI